MELELQSGNYCVELTTAQWDRLNELDYTSTVLRAMKDVGAHSVEYNGHFGQAIYFISGPCDAMYVFEKVRELVGAP